MSDLETKEGKDKRNQINGMNICFKDKTQNVVIILKVRKKRIRKQRYFSISSPTMKCNSVKQK